MQAFEEIVAAILESQGYWTKIGYKVNLTKEEKKEIKRPSAPRWEIDIIAYKSQPQELLMVECKSYIHSYGVSYESIFPTDDTINTHAVETRKSRYKLFVDNNLFNIVKNRLVTQLIECGSCREGVDVKLCLAAGNIRENDRENIRTKLKELNVILFDENWIENGLREFSQSKYENHVAYTVAQILLAKSINTKPKQKK